ncbi:hypothetical protein ACFX1Z_025217 [Malus domestica]
MSRTCSQCGNNGHNSRTCTDASDGVDGGTTASAENGIMLFDPAFLYFHWKSRLHYQTFSPLSIGVSIPIHDDVVGIQYSKDRNVMDFSPLEVAGVVVPSLKSNGRHTLR